MFEGAIMTVQENIKSIEKQLKLINRNVQKNGSTFNLILEISGIKNNIQKLTEQTQLKLVGEQVKKLKSRSEKISEKLLAQIPEKDLWVLSKHGFLDADWILGIDFWRKNHPNWTEYSENKKDKLWSAHTNLLEKGADGTLLSLSKGQKYLRISSAHRDGQVVNLKKAISYLELALSYPDTEGEAAFDLWNIYLDELDTPQKTKAHSFLKRAVARDYPEALAAYGRAHWGDWLVKNDDKKAFALIKKSQELGSEWGTDLLAQCYDLGLGTRKNAPKAFKLRNELSEDYSQDICCDLAEHYIEGKGVKKDTAEGLRLLRKAMKMGSGKAHWLMANLLQYGNETETNDVERFKVLSKSVELDEPYSLTFNQLATCYFFGDGTKQNFKKAEEIFTRLLEIGGTGMDEIIAKWHLEALKYDEPEDALEFLHAKGCAEDGAAEDQFELGNIYLEGKIIPADIKLAIKWFKLAADQGLPEAQESLGFIYSEGNGIPVDVKKASH